MLTQRKSHKLLIYTPYTSFSGLLHNTAVSGVNPTITPRFLSVGMAYDIIAVSDIIAVMILFDPQIKAFLFHSGNTVKTTPVAITRIQICC